DPNGVEYYFTCTAGGGNDSGWQDSLTYEDIGLNELTSYSYTVKARDKSSNRNETAVSQTQSALTPDGTAPTPDPMTWATVPYATGSTSVAMTATAATDPSGVEYYFTCTVGGGSDSGWQPGTIYIDTGLSELTTYTYTVKARDLSGNLIETAESAALAVTTDDSTSPLPNPTTWATEPYQTGTSSISMTATTATDVSGVEYYFTCSTPGGHNSGWQLNSTYVDTGLDDLTTYTYTAVVRDRSSSYNLTTASVARSATTQDGTAPSPDPATWAAVPYAIGSSSIAMTATTASDPDPGGVEYYFICTAGGGTDSGWQPSPTYIDSGLTELASYTYRVKTRDLSVNLNETALSIAQSATTEDTTAPLPNPMTWATVPFATSTSSISMTATTASDPSGVEYYFANITDPNHDSGWLAIATYIDTGLSELTSYTYTVKSRDLSGNQNETVVSGSRSATTDDGTPPTPDPMTWAVVPQSTDITTISMTATVATDISGVEYYFANVTDPAHDSGWRDSSVYVDTLLAERTVYTYTVTARDKSSSQNLTAASVAMSAVTQDGTPPAPDPMTWAAVPFTEGPSSISMTATTASDPNGVEYYFANITDPNHDSGWQDSRVYLDAGLAERTKYTYTVTARDKSPNLNETAASAAMSATTQDGTPPAPDPMTWATEP
ncbi:MAG: hypothetical protein KAR47_09220, partial [Planctomycetes bacterium]|nr:hypothetical protein [Planctomycetota bacterium]